MTQINLGRIGIVPKGEWNNIFTYNRLDLVAYAGGGYVSLVDNNNNKLPTDTAYWLQIAEKGETGNIENLNAQHIEDALGYIPANETEVTSHMADSASHGGIQHKNLLHNWDFRNPVNQRGQTEYTSGYTIDRWRIGGQGTVRVANGFIELKSTGTFYFWQNLENPQFYDGKTVTVSIEVDGQIYSSNGTINLNQGTNPTFANAFFSGGYAQVEYVTASQLLRFRVVITSGQTVSDITRVKLEIGSTSTLANDPPADYGEQLALCQRYYQTISRDPVGTGYISSAGTTAYIAVPTPVTMRTTPTLVGATAGDFKIRQKAIDITPTALDITKYDNCMVLRFTVEGATAREIASAYAVVNIALSADL